MEAFKVYEVSTGENDWYPYWFAANNESSAKAAYIEYTGTDEEALEYLEARECDEKETMCTCPEYTFCCEKIEGGACTDIKSSREVALEKLNNGEALPFLVASIVD